jgi:nucleoside-diphosphate-sugar epimerase
VSSKTCAITGVSGYVGSRVAGHLIDTGWRIRALCRSGLGADTVALEQARFELGHEVEPAALAGVEAMVHLAYDFSQTRWRDIERVNIVGSSRLFAAARDAGIERVVFVSSVAAFPQARSMYGRAKLEIESAALDRGATVIRPGLVWGPRGAAAFGALQRAVARLSIVPLLIPPETPISLVHEDDLSGLVECVLELWPESSGKLLVGACPQVVTFVDLLDSLARAAGKRPRFVRLPWRAVWLGLRSLEMLGLRAPFRSDSLVSLVAADSEPLVHGTDSAERYGVRWRPYALD